MAKADQTAAIKAANGTELDADTYSGAQLTELQKLAEADKTDLTAFTAKREEFDRAKTAAATAAAKEKTVTVRVNAAIAAYGGEFTDPDTHAVIGAKAAAVPYSAFVREKLRSEELVEE
jgi:glucose dehydrogenase